MIHFEALPQVARELVRVIGLDATLALCEARGGLPLAVPMRLAPDGTLIVEIGSLAAEKLIAEFGGNRIEVPKLTALAASRRDELIRDALRAGRSTAEIALRFNLTTRHIRRIRAAGVANSAG